MTTQDRPHARGCENHAHPCQLTVDSPVAPRRVLLGQPQHQLHRASWEVWSARAALLTICPLATDRCPVPAQQRLGFDEEPTPAHLRHQPAQAGKDRPIGWPQSRTLGLATQDRDLVSEHDDLDRQFVLFAPAKSEQLEYPNEGHIEEVQRHDQSSLALYPQRKSRWTAWMRFSAPSGSCAFRSCSRRRPRAFLGKPGRAPGCPHRKRRRQRAAQTMLTFGGGKRLNDGKPARRSTPSGRSR